MAFDADHAYNVTNFAYNGIGVFVYQGSDGAVEAPKGGAGYPVYRKRRRLTDFPNKHLESILNEVVEEYYAEIIASDLPREVKQEAAEVVRPFAKKTRGYPRQIDWTALKLEADRVSLLIQIYQEELNEDDDEFMMMH
jgi:hypothetical protein